MLCLWYLTGKKKHMAKDAIAACQARPPPHSARLYEYSSSIFWLIHRTTELARPVSNHEQPFKSKFTLKAPESHSPQSHQRISHHVLISIDIIGHWTPGTTNLSTKTVTPPAIPPASAANPRKSTTRAFHATPVPL